MLVDPFFCFSYKNSHKLYIKLIVSAFFNIDSFLKLKMKKNEKYIFSTKFIGFNLFFCTI